MTSLTLTVLLTSLDIENKYWKSGLFGRQKRYGFNCLRLFPPKYYKVNFLKKNFIWILGVQKSLHRCLFFVFFRLLSLFFFDVYELWIFLNFTSQESLHRHFFLTFFWLLPFNLFFIVWKSNEKNNFTVNIFLAFCIPFKNKFEV